MIKIIETLNKSKNKKSSLDIFLNKHGIESKGTGIGFSEKEQKWYGYSHRAICGFGIGDICNGDLGLGDGYTFKSGDKLKTLDDCKQRAKDFAKSID